MAVLSSCNNAAPEPYLANRQLLFVGDSKTVGHDPTGSPTDPKQAPPAQAAQLFPPMSWSDFANLGENGNTIANVQARAGTITSHYNFIAYPEGIDIVLNIGVNDIGKSNPSVAALGTAMESLIAALKAPNPAKVRVHVSTLEATVWPVAVFNTPFAPAVVTAKINVFNAAVRANCTAWGATDFIDEARATELQNPADATYYYPDELHLRPAANRRKAQVYIEWLVNHIQPSGPILQ